MNVPQTLVEAAAKGADKLMHELKGIKAIVISTADGFELVGRAENNASVSRLAAMASSLTALGALAGEESDLGTCDNVTIEAAEGVLFMVQVPVDDAYLIVSVITGRDAIIGQVRFMTKQFTKSLGLTPV